MQPRIEHLEEKKLAGLHLMMSLSNDRTPELWRTFMPRRSEVSGSVGTELYSLQIHPPTYFDRFDPTVEFEKWAACEVSSFGSIPSGMDTLVVPAGMYAVFTHKGGAATGPEIFGYIFGTWLPGSEYMLDHRPHFEVLGEKYRNGHPDSEEDIWIPVRPRRR